MSVDATYSPVDYIYRSKGLWARNVDDQCPEYVYLDMLNGLERAENSMSSRYGCQIINRDAAGSGTSNYFFTSPVTSLARLTYQSNAWRYAGLQNGTLQIRAGNTQGAYTQIYTGLSGNAFESLVTNCYETSTPYLFIFDSLVSIKSQPAAGTVQLTGLDSPAYTANATPYSPLLTIIDDFASTNTYTTGSVTSWAEANITTLTATSGQNVTDFTQFFGIQPTGGSSYAASGVPNSASYTQSGSGSGSQTSTATSGFASVVPAAGETVTVSFTISGSITVVSAGSGYGGGSVAYEYSADGGVTWTSFYGIGGSSDITLPSTNIGVTIPSIANLNDLYMRVYAEAAAGGTGPPTITAAGSITAAVATITAPSVFGIVAPGMISLLNPSNTTINVPISNIISSGLSSGIYTTLTITTLSAHGLTTGNQIAIYGSSNDMVDGFYTATVTGTTTFTVPFSSTTQIGVGANGGYVVGGAAAPIACVLGQQYSTPYPTQLSAYGFYQQVPTSTTSFPISAWAGDVAASTTGTVNGAITIDLNQDNQITDDDLIVLTMAVSNPNNISQITLQFNCGTNTSPTSYYQKIISPAYYQQGVSLTQNPYSTTSQQILAETLGLTTGAVPNSIVAQLQSANISTGAGSWVAIYMRRGDFLPVGQAGQSGLDWSSIQGWTLSVTTNANSGGVSFSCNGLYLQWGYGPSSYGGIGYDYRYTFYNSVTGTESNPSPEQEFNTQFGYLASLTAPIVLRQAFQVTGYFPTDPQDNYIRVYRRGGTLASNWFQVAQFAVPTGATGQFTWKDITPDALLAQATPLVLDNDPPVTSSLPQPIITALSAATTGPAGSVYSTFLPQTITVQQADAVFVPNQIVDIGYPQNLEQVQVISGGTGQFTAIVRLTHNIGDPVAVYSIPRQPCNLCALAYGQVWLAGDPNNPHYLYYSKKGLPENFGPQNYIPVSSPDDPIMAVINWRGTLVVATLKSWWIIVGGSQPYPQPTGSAHGLIAQQAWTLVEGSIWYLAADGLREFSGSDGVYKTLPVEWIFRGNPLCIPPQVYQPDASNGLVSFFNNCVYYAYTSNNNGAAGPTYRLVFDTQYQRFRYDDVPATAMLWEKDINSFLVGKEISSGNYAVVQDWVGDYDDGGWVAGSLVQTPINLVTQTPYFDVKKPHNPKQWNMLETDVNTQGQDMTTTLLFEDGQESITLDVVNTAQRQKVELWVEDGEGYQAYRASIQHSIQVTTAPIIYQDNIYVTELAEYSASYDTYWIKFGTDFDKFVKQGWFDYTSALELTGSLYADNSPTPYFTFTLPAQSERYVQRVRFSNVNPGTTAFTMRTWRMIVLTPADADSKEFQFWANPLIQWKTVGQSGYQRKELVAQ